MAKKEVKKLVLIDGHALVHRAFHALPPTLTSPKGVLTNAVYGFLSLLIKAIKDLKPDYIAATFDLAGPTFRHEEFAEYKVHRQKAPDELHAQVPIIKDLLVAFGIPIYQKQGFEADDLIGALSEKAKKNKDLQTIIMTGDLDTLQLVDGNKVVVFTLRKGLTDTVIYDEDEVRKRYGFEPSQVTDYKGLKGDPSDNIPGVSGIGEKTGTDLVKKFGSIEKLYQELESKDKKKAGKRGTELSPKLVEKLLANKDMAFFSKKLATIIRDVEVDFNLDLADWRKNLDKDKLRQLMQDLGFYSLIKRFSEINIDGVETAGEQSAMLFDSKQPDSDRGIKIKEIKNSKEVNNLLVKIKNSKFLAVNFEGNKASFAFDEKECFVIGTDLIWSKPLLGTWKEIFEDPKIKKNGHDLKILIKDLLEKGIHLEGVEFDSKIAAYLLNSDIKDYALEKIYFNEFHENIDINPLKKTAYILKLKKNLWEKLKSEDVLYVMEKIEMPLEIVIAEMERTGVKVDLKAVEVLAKDTEKEIAKLEEGIYKSAGSQFNINSPQQLSEVLFQKLGLKGKVKKTGKGALSTAASELEKLSGEHPVIEMILRYREVQKLKTTYIDPFPQLVRKDGRLSTTFNQTGTTTGRLSSENPNLQNIPVRTELGQEFRMAFIASPGYQMVSFDYSQLELRIAAHISKDPKMTDAFKRGEDIHTRTAAEIYGVPPEKVDTAMRRQAKVMNFGLLYGMGILGFQRASGVNRDRAREFIDRYMTEFIGIARYMNEMKEKARKVGYVTTLFGRKRWFPEINSRMPQLVSQAERMAINMPIQGTEADLLKMSMIKIHDLIHSEGKEDDVRLLVQVHDELLFEIKKDSREEWVPKIRDIMENIHKFNVPLTVDAKYGNNWAEMDKI